MKNLPAIGKAILADLAQLEKPAIASLAAGVLLPGVAAVAGVNITAAELAGDLALFGLVAATLQKVLAKPAAPAPAPPPVVPPAPPVPPAPAK